MKLFFTKSVFFMLLFAFSGIFSMAQTIIKGKVIDDVTKETLPGVSVIVKDFKAGTSTGGDGTFQLKVSGSGRATVSINSVGYIVKELIVNLNGAVQDLGVIPIVSSGFSMKDVNVTAGVAVERKTPIAISTIRAEQIENKSPNAEFPEILKGMPSIYTSKAAGGFGDSRVTIRGFDMTNVAVMINGVPVNDMENATVYWSNWSGLMDVASSVQVQRGIGASKLSVPSVGGTINVVTKPTELEAGGIFKNAIGNDGFQKYTLGYNTGLMKNGLAFSMLGSYNSGNGYIDGTGFQAWTYFLSAGWKINDKHTLTFSATGAPQWHYQSYASRYTAYQNNISGRKYNYESGYYQGEEVSPYKNVYHKPVFNLNHYWKIDDKTQLNTVAYASFGRGNGSSTLGTSVTNSIFQTVDGTINFNDIQKFNRGTTIGTTTGISPYTVAGPYLGKYIITSSKGVGMYSSVNNHNWYGLIVNGSRDISDKFKLSAGLDYRYYKGLHYGKLANLYGADGYYDSASKQVVTEEGGDTPIVYNYNGYVNWIGGYLSAEYSDDVIDAFASGTLNNTGYRRETLFFTGINGQAISDTYNFLGYSAKGGINLKVSDQHNFYANAGYFNRAPLFKIVFPGSSATTENGSAKNEKITDYELGYGFRSGVFNLKLNAYYTKWKDRSFIRSVTENDVTTYANLSGFGELHKGLELEMSAKPFPKLELTGMVSAGDWKYTSDATAVVTNANGEITGTYTTYFAGLKVGSNAQTTAALGANYEVLKGVKVFADYTYADKLYSNISIGGTSLGTANTSLWELPSYGLVNLGMSYSFLLKNLPVTLRGNIDNVFNKYYLSESTSNYLYSTSTTAGDYEIGNNGSASNYVYYGFGRTWTLGLSIKF
ncbi:TonB-dependent receptor domain-containing protein [Pedobacter sp. BMA]|uniref:TonB-dependent receptor n=1 Tax=Pedobacter sp. BMA TaxID=1663685 RepID=UPI00064A5EE9|nr:TonB-dependent receptor [Pedobacter sp. BMA]KLT67250.1 hypothetical protein AB669_00555 [Pedobacter sp. BMA]